MISGKIFAYNCKCSKNTYLPQARNCKFRYRFHFEGKDDGWRTAILCVFKRGQKLPIFEATLLMDGPTSIDKLSEQQKSDVVNFMNIFSRIYPCTHCADDLKVDLGSDFLKKKFSHSLKFLCQERNWDKKDAEQFCKTSIPGWKNWSKHQFCQIAKKILYTVPF